MPVFRILVGNLEDALSGSLWNRIALPVPVVNVATTALDAGQVQRRQTKQGDRFGFTFAEITQSQFAVVQCAFAGVAEQYVGQFVKSRFCAASDRPG